MSLRPDAGRYECGTLNTVGIYGLRASIGLLLEIGIATVGDAVQMRSDQVAEGLLGCEILGDRTTKTSSGITSFRKRGENYLVTMRRLKDCKIMAAPRQGWIRVSPHFYTAPQDIEALIEAVAN